MSRGPWLLVVRILIERREPREDRCTGWGRRRDGRHSQGSQGWRGSLVGRHSAQMMASTAFGRFTEYNSDPERKLLWRAKIRGLEGLAEGKARKALTYRVGSPLSHAVSFAAMTSSLVTFRNKEELEQQSPLPSYCRSAEGGPWGSLFAG